MLIGKGSQLPQPQGERCRRCAKLIRQDGHAGFCSSDCQEAEKVEVSQDKLRAVVFERDKGQCARCQVNALELRAELDAIIASLKPERPSDLEWVKAWRAWTARRDGLAKRGFDLDAIESGGPLWECAHVVARVQGGRNHPDNCVSLCLECHKADSKALAQGRARSRRVGGWRGA